MFKQTPKGYAELIAGDPNTELLVQRKFKATDRKRTSAYGMPDETSALGSFFSPQVHSGSAISLNEEVTYTKTETYYICAAGKYVLANKSGFSKVFGKGQPYLEKYLKESPVDFQKQADVMRLFKYCTQE
jgi:hypothetical protein